MTAAPISTEKLLEMQSRRYSVKQFKKNTAISDDTWNALAQCLMLTPSSYGIQPWKFIAITDPGLKRSLRSASFGQAQIEDCSHLIIFCALEKMSESWVTRWIDRLSEVRNVPRESLGGHEAAIVNDLVSGPRKDSSLEFNTQQCYIALGNLITSAALLGVDSCPIGGFVADVYDDILQISGSGWRSVVLCALGYRDPADKYSHSAKARFPIDEIIENR